MANIRTHYDNLRVARNAPDSVIKAAYKALCQTYHPDKFQGSNAEAERIMKLINASYVVLIDPVKRAEHDAWIQAQEAEANQPREKATFGETGNGTEQEFYQKQETKWKYTPPPTEPEPPEADTSLHLWRRYFARLIDYFICALLLIFVLVAWSATGQSLPNAINEAINNPNLSSSQQMINWSIVSTFFWVILEPICLSMFGTTIGKALFRLRLVSDNSKPNYWGRSVAVWLLGMGGGLPVISAFFMLNAAAKLKKNGQTEWDRRTGFSVEAEPLSILRRASLTVLIVLVIIANGIIGKFGGYATSSQQPIQQAQVVQNVPQVTPVKAKDFDYSKVDLDNINPNDISFKGYEHLFKPEEKPVAPQATTGNTGCIGNCINGQGTLTYTNGDKYTGQFRNGQPDGQGTLIYVNGNKYVGEFRNNIINGQGAVTYANGDKYEGIMTNGMQEGQGTLTYANGTKVTGEWRNNQLTQATPSRKGMFDEFLPKQSSANKPTEKASVLPTKEERAGTGMFDEFLQPSQQAPLQRADDLHKQGRYAEAFQLYQGLAVQGDARAQYNLGFMYLKGQSVAQDDNQAAYWYRKAAEQGDANAQISLSAMYGTGRGVVQNQDQACFWLRKAAEQGDAKAIASFKKLCQ